MFDEFINTVTDLFLNNQLPDTFTIPHLYKCICDTQPDFQSIGYKEFRKMLYQNPTNQVLSLSKLTFKTVVDNGHVDRNLYQIMST